MALLFTAVYLLVSRWNLHRFDHGLEPWELWTGLDRRLPVVPWAIWLYAVYYPLAFTPLVLVRTRYQLVEVLAAFVLATAVGWISFVVFPVRMEYPELACSGPSCALLERLYAWDRGVNIFPSLHATHSVLALTVFLHHGSRWWPLVAVGALLACVGAVLTRQHYVLDVPAGAALGYWSWPFARWLLARAPLGAIVPAGAVQEE